MNYPLIIEGREQGELRVEKSGLYTVFEAELKNVYEGLYRLWIYGGGERAYLGLMQPWSGGMYLRRKLSRRDMEGFPKSIEYASNSDGLSLHNIEAPEPEKAPGPAQLQQGTAAACPWPAPVEEQGELLWLLRADGSLVSHDGISSLVALPASLRKKREGAALRMIEGREYIVFRY